MPSVAILSVVMLNITKKTYMLSVFMLIVVILSVFMLSGDASYYAILTYIATIVNYKRKMCIKLGTGVEKKHTLLETLETF